MSGYHLCVPGTCWTVKRFGGHGADRKPALPAVKWWRVAKRGPCVMKPANANTGFNAPKCSRNCSLFFRLPSPDNGRLHLGRVTPVETQVATQIGGLHDGTTGLRILNLPAAVSDWFSGSVGDLRRMGSTSGSPKNRPDLRLRVSIRLNGVNLQHWPGLWHSGFRPSGLQLSGLRPHLRLIRRIVTGFTPGLGPPA